jgi:prepilin-type N-terminal cleavage/methylation domain-containing protein
MISLFNRKNKTGGNTGFTVTELIIVIVVIGVLAIASLVSYAGIARQAAGTTLMYDLIESARQLETDKARNDIYPATVGAANNSAGLSKSPNTVYQYNVVGKNYCLGASYLTDPSATYRITSDTNSVSEGSCANSWKVIGAGANGMCGINFNNATYCWGSNYDGAIGDNTYTDRISPTLISVGAIPAGVYLTSIDMGDDHSCGIGSNNRIYCWGANWAGQGGTGATSPSYNKTATVVATGAIPAGVTIKSIAAGSLHTCALGSNGRVYCWGYGADGAIGNGAFSNATSPALVSTGAIPGGVTIESIKASNGFTCGLGSNGKVYCWGDNYLGQLGDNTTTNRNTPVAVLAGAVPGGVTLKNLTVGAYHSCATASDNNVYCWGFNAMGQLGSGNTTDSKIPVKLLSGEIPGGTTLTSLEAGWYFTCGIGSNDLTYCWGDNSYQEIGNSSVSSGTSPMAVTGVSLPSDTKISQLSGGVSYMCGLTKASGTTYCWGDNMSGQLGIGITNNKNAPVAVSRGSMPGGVTVQKVSTSNFHSCLLGSDGKTYCWGYGLRSELGNGTDGMSNVPVTVVQGAIPGGVTATDVVTGWGHTCILGTNGWVYCWGDGTNGQLGNGANGSSNTPVAISQGAIPGGVTLTSIVQGGNFTCALGSNSKAYCWGDNIWAVSVGIGDGTTLARNTPVAVAQGAMPGGVTVKSLAVSGIAGFHMCLIGSDDKSYCWGKNWAGALGDGTQTDRTSPVAVLAGAVPGGTTPKSISVGNYHTCMVGSNDKIYCWGLNNSSELGVSGGFRTTPVATLTGSMPAGVIKSVFAGRDKTCAIGSSDRAYCWGSNQFGNLGVGVWSDYNYNPVTVANGEMLTGTFKSVSPGFLHSCGVSLDNKAYCWGSGYRGGLLGNGAIDFLGYPKPIASF